LWLNMNTNDNIEKHWILPEDLSHEARCPLFRLIGRLHIFVSSQQNNKLFGPHPFTRVC
jgi:hypothetical protein